MGFFKKSYEPGGEFHIRITDEAFNEAMEIISKDSSLQEQYKKLAQDEDCAKYEAHDFPVSEIIGRFLLGYELQEEKNGIPEDLRIGNIQLGRKDQVEYSKFVDVYNARIEMRAEDDAEDWKRKGLGGKLFSMAAGAAAKGIKNAATGKSEDVRWFEKTFANYICGDSEKAKEYLLQYATEFGGQDEGLTDVAKVVRELYWISEFAKKNRGGQ